MRDILGPRLEVMPDEWEAVRDKLIEYIHGLQADKLEGYFQLYDITPDLIEDPAVQEAVDLKLSVLDNSANSEYPLPPALTKRMSEFLRKRFKFIEAESK